MKAVEAIGIFDSGVGGLTVVSEIKKCFPDKKFIYFGDTARIPYGTKSASMITKCALQDCRFLLSRGVGGIIAACGTVSANSIDALKAEFDIPIAGIVEGAAMKAVQVAANGNGVIGVIGTSAAIKSHAYERAVAAIDGSVKVYTVACPMFVPIVENGFADSEVADIVAKKYLSEMAEIQPAAVILGCTHYPLLINAISPIFPQSVLINAGRGAVEGNRALCEVLSAAESGESEYYVSDDPELFAQNAKKYLGEDISGKVNKIDIEEY